jgi:arylsulfatase A-like enzyme
MDDQVGRLRKELEKLKVDENTMLWFCSDNGPARQGSPRQIGSNGGLSGHKLSLREGGIRVPGLLVWPKKFKKAKTITTPCVTTDYFPTIMAALDIPLAKDRPYDGINILPLIEDETKKRETAIGFIHGDTKVWTEHQYKLFGNKKNWQLYDLAKELPEVKERMVKDFDAWYPGVMADLKKVP